jgi:hypothetical protein
VLDQPVGPLRQAASFMQYLHDKNCGFNVNSSGPLKFVRVAPFNKSVIQMLKIASEIWLLAQSPVRSALGYYLIDFEMRLGWQ